MDGWYASDSIVINDGGAPKIAARIGKGTENAEELSKKSISVDYWCFHSLHTYVLPSSNSCL